MAWQTTTPGSNGTSSPHGVIKPEKIVQTALAALEQELVVPKLFTREGLEKFAGSEGDAYTVKVEGVLPYRSYGWRANRSQEVVFDDYKERKLTVEFGDDIYSAVRLTDEQVKMDMLGWGKLATKQVEAIAFGLDAEACNYLQKKAPYEVVVTLSEADLRRSLIELRGILNKLRVKGARTLLVGSDLETALLDDDKLNLAMNVGDGEAVSALRNATLGRRYGFDFVVADELNPGLGVAMTSNAMVMTTGAPEVPASVGFGASASTPNGVALRWIRHYESTRFREQSIFNTYKGFRHVDDPLVGKDANDQSFVSEQNHFVRAVKVELGSAFSVKVSNSELANITGIKDTDGVHEDGNYAGPDSEVDPDDTTN